MNNDQLREKLSTMLPKAEISEGKPYLTISVPGPKLLSFAKDLKENSETLFDYLICVSGVDYTKNMAVFYHLTSSVHNHTIVLKSVIANREAPAIDSVCGIWKTAEYHEREAYDLLGINFKGHPDMRRMFLDENWVGHPLRKDYTDPVNMIER